jgi:hypothetical protein
MITKPTNTTTNNTTTTANRRVFVIVRLRLITTDTTTSITMVTSIINFTHIIRTISTITVNMTTIVTIVAITTATAVCSAFTLQECPFQCCSPVIRRVHTSITITVIITSNNATINVIITTDTNMSITNGLQNTTTRGMLCTQIR